MDSGYPTGYERACVVRDIRAARHVDLDLLTKQEQGEMILQEITNAEREMGAAADGMEAGKWGCYLSKLRNVLTALN